MNGFIALIRRPREEGGWQVAFPDLPDCRAAGESLEQALANARAALASHLAEIAVSGKARPLARSPGAMLLDANEDPSLACQMVGAVLKTIEPEPVATLRATTSAVRRQYGFYGEERPSQRA